MTKTIAKEINVRFCGFGGQGIVLSAVIFGSALVLKKDYHVVQTQSYGSEARGGQCQAELIVSSRRINSPIVEQKDLLVALFQTAYDRYLPSLKQGGALVIDPKLVTNLGNLDGRRATVYRVPAAETAVALGNRITANMVVLGYLQQATGLLSKQDLVEIVSSHVPQRFLELNLKAVDAGIGLARGLHIPLGA